MRTALLSVLLLAASGCDTGEPGPPRSATILKVTVDAAPLADPAGAGWDGDNPLSDGPEVYFRLFDDAVDYRTDPGDDRLNPRDDGSVFALGSEQPWFDDVEEADFPLVWEVEPGYVVRDLDDPLYVALFDYDPTTGDDPMAESEVFTLREVAPAIVTGRAEVIRLLGFDRNGDAVDDVEVRLTVEFFD
ncbi:hypothetical protein [Rubrivirga sp.]|uniref:hypothetical protein n=1 Tax=Rubrivirga sp. TaxID=1885344 RepID=UPI003B51C44C